MRLAWRQGAPSHGATSVGARRSRGQSVTEFALVVPVVLALVLFTLDLGRLFYSYVTITSAARVGANYAGANPNADWGASSDYETRVMDDGLKNLSAFCTLPSPNVPAPDFSDSAYDGGPGDSNLGDLASVTISCNFSLVTPILGSFVGNSLDIESTAVFPIRQGPLP